VVERDLRAVSISFANTIFHRDRKNREGIMKVLSLPALSGSWQRSFQELLHTV
jgi:MOSC domain-containing protein YiiM